MAQIVLVSYPVEIGRHLPSIVTKAAKIRFDSFYIFLKAQFFYRIVIDIFFGYFSVFHYELLPEAKAKNMVENSESADV